MRRRRPILGIFSGLVFGVFLALDLVLFGVVATDSILVTIAPLVGLVLGVIIGFRPRGQGRAAKDVVPPEAAAQAVAGNAPAAVTAEAAPPPPPPADDQPPPPPPPTPSP